MFPGSTPLRGERRTLLAWYLFFVVLLSACVGFLAMHWQSSGFIFTIWADRDLHRAFTLSTLPQVTGPEATGTGRTPGGFYYSLLSAILYFRSDSGFVFLASVGLGAGALLIFSLTALRYFGVFEALAFVVFFLGSAQLAASVTVLWNPSFVWLFLALSYAVFVRLLARKSDAELPWLVLCTALGAQIHMSLYSLLIAEVLALILLVGRIGFRIWVLSIAALVVVLSPYLLSEWSNGFANSRLLSNNHSLPLLFTAITRLPLSFASLLVTAFGVDGTWMLGLYPAGLQALALIGTSFLVVISVFHYGGNAIRALREKYPAAATPIADLDDSDRVKRGLGLVLVLGFLIQRVGGIHEAIVARYFLILAPAALYLSVAALRVLAHRASQIESVWPRRGACGSLMIWAATMIGFNLLHAATMRDAIRAFGLVSHGQLQDIRRFAATHFGFSADDTARQTLLVVKGTDRDRPAAWSPVSPETYVSWPTYAEPWDDSGGQTDVCLLVMINPIPRHQEPSHEPTREEALQALRRLAPSSYQEPTIRRLATTPQFTYVVYDSLAGNCLRNLSHPYNLSPTERRLELHRAAIAAAGVHALGGGLYGVRLNRGADVQLGGIRIDAQRGRIFSTLYGNALRGYDGNTSRSLERPKLVFTSQATGESFEQTFFDGTFGGSHAIVLPPWHATPIRLPDAKYAVRFVAKYIADVRFGRAEDVDLEWTLDSNFIVDSTALGKPKA